MSASLDGRDTGNPAAAPSWVPLLRVPRGWTLDLREADDRLTISAASELARCTIILDLLTRETVVSVNGELAERDTVARFVGRLVQRRQERDRQDPLFLAQGIPPTDPADVSTWTSMQLMAAITGGRWSLSPLFGGSPALDREVNGAFLTTVWGL